MTPANYQLVDVLIAGAGNADPIPNISDPMGFKKAVNEAQAAARTLLRGGR